MSYADQLDSWTGLCGVRHKAGRHRLVHIGPVHLADLPPQGPNGWLPCVALWSTRTSSAQLSAALSEACRTPPQPPMTSLLVMCFGVPAQSPPHASPFLQPQKFGLPVLTFGVPSLGSLYPQPSLPFPVPPHPNSNSWLADFDPAAYPPPPPLPAYPSPTALGHTCRLLLPSTARLKAAPSRTHTASLSGVSVTMVGAPTGRKKLKGASSLSARVAVQQPLVVPFHSHGHQRLRASTLEHQH